jgi:hypothetical protein
MLQAAKHSNLSEFTQSTKRDAVPASSYAMAQKVFTFISGFSVEVE